MTETPQPSADFARTSSRHFLMIAISGAPVFIALALIGFSPVPMLGWVLFVVGTAAVVYVASRSILFARDRDDPRLRALGLQTLPFAATPLIVLGFLLINGSLTF